MIRVLASAAAGVLAASILLLAVGLDDGASVWLLPVATIVMVIGLLLTGIARSFGGTLVVADKDLATAERENRISLARVLDTRATGTSVNDQPLCEIRMVVAPRTRAPYETTARELVNLGRLPSLQRGAVVVVVQPKAERPEVALLQPPPDHWQRLADEDTQVRALTSAPVWELAPERGRDRRGFVRIPAVVLVVVAVLGFGARLYPIRSEVGQLLEGESLSDVVAAHDDRARQQENEKHSILPAEQTQQVVDDLAASAGGTQFVEIGFHGTFAVAEALTSPGATTTDSFTWRDGEATRDGAAPIQPPAGSLPDELFDVTTVDWSLVGALAARAPGLTGIEDTDPPTIVVRRATIDKVTTPVEFLVMTSDDYYSAYLHADLTGQVVEMRGGAPGSQSAAWEAASS